MSCITPLHALFSNIQYITFYKMLTELIINEILNGRQRKLKKLLHSRWYVTHQNVVC